MTAQPGRKARVQESTDEIVEFYMSLGYARGDVMRALDATTWVPGLASQVMEKLKSGEDLPSTWRGVWTQKDDRSLRTIMLAAAAEDDEPEPREDARERRKREKQREWLWNKHSREGVEMRIRFLETQDKARRVRFAA